MTATKTPEEVQLRPPRQSRQQHMTHGQAEKDELVQPGEGKAEMGSCCGQLTGRRVESRVRLLRAPCLILAPSLHMY